MGLHGTSRAKISRETSLVQQCKGKRFPLVLALESRACFKIRLRNKAALSGVRVYFPKLYGEDDLSKEFMEMHRTEAGR